MAETRTSTLAAYAAGVQIGALPPSVIERAKMICFDEVACAVLGRELVPGRAIAEWVRSQGGSPQASVLAAGFRAPPVFAALANGTAGHADEFDGAHVTDGHPGAVIVHAALAAAERLRASGARFIAALALGYDVSTRLVTAVGGAYSLRTRHRVHSDHLHGYGAAAACAALAELDADGQRHALALVAGNAGGHSTVLEERGHMTKAFSTGQAAFAGTMAAELAAAGFEGHDDIFDTVHGPLGWAEGEARLDLASLGRDHAVMGANFKFYSAGYPIHAPAEAAMGLVKDNGLCIGDIAGMTISLPSSGLDTVRARAMKSIDLAHMVAVAVAHGDLGFDTAHSNAALDHPDVKKLKMVTTLEGDAELDRTQPRGRGARVVIQTKDGVRLERLVEHPKGHTLRGDVTWDDLCGKWEVLMPKRIGAARHREFVAACRGLETMADIGELTGILET